MTVASTSLSHLWSCINDYDFIAYIHIICTCVSVCTYMCVYTHMHLPLCVYGVHTQICMCVDVCMLFSDNCWLFSKKFNKYVVIIVPLSVCYAPLTIPSPLYHWEYHQNVQVFLKWKWNCVNLEDMFLRYYMRSDVSTCCQPYSSVLPVSHMLSKHFIPVFSKFWSESYKPIIYFEKAFSVCWLKKQTTNL